MNDPNKHSGWRGQLYHIIYEAETPAGKLFDVLLLWAIVFSLVAVCLESVVSIADQYGLALRIAEWSFTALFTIEYILRILCVRFPRKYIFSFLGIVDFLAILPTYISLYVVGSQSLLVIRAIRLLRIFRVLKLHHYLAESQVIVYALRQSRNKILVFLCAVLVLDLVFGAMMYLIEGPDSGFTSIPKSMYWSIVTMTTVGYGDITPHTPLGQFVAAVIMILGYGIIAVPTGIVTSEFTIASRRNYTSRVCPSCTREDHRSDSVYCRFCSSKL